MATFQVTWEMEIDADTPQAAAEIARSYQRDPAAYVGAFCVFNEDGNATNVDLDALDEGNPVVRAARDHGWSPQDSDSAAQFLDALDEGNPVVRAARDHGWSPQDSDSAAQFLDALDEGNPVVRAARDHGWSPQDSDSAAQFCETEGIDPATGEYTEDNAS